MIWREPATSGIVFRRCWPKEGAKLSRFSIPGTDNKLIAWFERVASRLVRCRATCLRWPIDRELAGVDSVQHGYASGGYSDLLPPVSEEVLARDLLKDARVVVLIVIDGLGSLALRDAVDRGDAPGLSSAMFQSTLTSVFPATTAAATTSLQYGLAPGTHGMAGYTLYLPEIDDVFNMITWRRSGNGRETGEEPEPETFLSGTHLFSRLNQLGIDTVIVSNAAFATSPLTRAQASGVRYRGYRTLSEFSYRLIREIERPGRRFVFGYWDGYDALGHTWGSDAEIARSGGAPDRQGTA